MFWLRLVFFPKHELALALGDLMKILTILEFSICAKEKIYRLE